MQKDLRMETSKQRDLSNWPDSWDRWDPSCIVVVVVDRIVFLPDLLVLLEAVE